MPTMIRLLLLATQATTEVSGLERDGLWLIGIGAAVVAAAVLIGGHVGGLSGRPFTQRGLRPDRLVYAGATAGGTLVAVGSIFVALKHLPSTAVLVGVVIWIPLAIWLLAAWRLRIGTQRDLTQAHANLTQYPAQAAGIAWDIRTYEHQVRWTYCIRHAFDADVALRLDAERLYAKGRIERSAPATDSTRTDGCSLSLRGQQRKRAPAAPRLPVLAHGSTPRDGRTDSAARPPHGAPAMLRWCRACTTATSSATASHRQRT
jgi:hypothetical protein